MNNMSTRTAPQGARFMQASAPLLLQLRDGRNLQFSSAAELMSAVRQLAAGQSDPSPNPPDIAPDTGARLDAPDAELKNHESQAPAMLDGRAINARVTNRATGPKATAILPMLAMLQTSAGPRLDARAINARASRLGAS